MPTPQRLPIVNSDDGVWGDILLQYLKKEHYDDGNPSGNAANGGHQFITIRAGVATSGGAPLKFTSGTLLTTPETGALEFAGDYAYITDTSGPTRRKIAAYDDTGSATGDIYYRNGSGYFTRLGIGSSNTMLKVSSGIPAWSSTISGATIDNSNTITVKDANFTLQDDGDTTKQMQFQLSGITTGTTRTLTVPDASGTLALASNIGMLQPVQGMTLGTETFTISGGSVTQINGTTINGFTPAIGDRILIANAPATTGVGTGYSMTTQPTNGIYTVTANTTNLTVSRSSDMSGSVKPGGLSVNVEQATWPMPNTQFWVITPNGTASFTWGTNNIRWDFGGGAGGAFEQIWINSPAAGINVWNNNSWSTLSFNASGTQTLTMPSVLTDTIVSRTSTDTLTNKTLTGAKFDQLKDTNGNVILDTSPVASAVNYLQLQNGAAGNKIRLITAGSDTDIAISIRSKGTGSVYLADGSGNVMLEALPQSSPVNYWTMLNSATTNALQLQANGTDTDISMNLVPKGAGKVKAGGVEVATISAAQTLTNKTLDNTNQVTLKDSKFTLQDDGDTTKQAVFQLSGISTGTTRTYTLPDASGTILTSASATFSDSQFTLQDDGDTTKQLQFQLSGITTGTTRTLTVPDANTTIVGTDATQTLTSKTVSDTFMGKEFDTAKTQRDTTLLASNDFKVTDTLEINASYSLEIPATSTLEVINVITQTITQTNPPGTAHVATQEATTSSGVWADLATTTDQVTVNISSSGLASVFISAYFTEDTAAAYPVMGFAVSGATTVAADVSMCIAPVTVAGYPVPGRFGAPFLVTGLNAGATTFKAKYQASGGGSATFADRRISVIPL
jgi:hypothetical protein